MIRQYFLKESASTRKELKNLLRESLQTTSEVEITSTLAMTNIKNLIIQTIVMEQIKIRIKSKGSFPTTDSAFKILYMSKQEVQQKWGKSSVRNWSEIYPQLCIFFSEIMEKYTK